MLQALEIISAFISLSISTMAVARGTLDSNYGPTASKKCG
jgi:hypothetical protein